MRGGDAQRRVLDERADPLGDVHAAGLAQQLDALPARGDRLGERVRERRLAGAVEPLDRDQAAARHAGTVAPRRGRSRAPLRWAPWHPPVKLQLRLRPRRRRRDDLAALPGIDAHPHARAVLAPALRAQASLSHAYLFHGPSGTGKRTIARAFAAALLSDSPQQAAQARERIARGTHPDLTWVTPSGAAEMLVADIEEPVVAPGDAHAV